MSVIGPVQSGYHEAVQ